MGSRISPTAHYTGYVWVRNGLSDPAFETLLGRAMFRAWQPVMALARPALGGMTLERYLVDRHRMLDRLLEDAIERDGVTQVLEVAAGLSPRGLTFSERYPDVVYVEADLEPMVARKRSILDRAGHHAPNHKIVDVDLLASDGPDSLEAVTSTELDGERPTAIVAEGLLSYFDSRTLVELWPRLVASLHGFPRGRFLANLELGEEAGEWMLVRWFLFGLGRAVAAPARLCFIDEAQARSALKAAGFDQVVLHAPRDLLGDARGPLMVRAVEARVAGTANT